jgi:hypothetical protein
VRVGLLFVLAALCLLYGTAAAQSLGSVLTDAPKCAVGRSIFLSDGEMADDFLDGVLIRCSRQERVCGEESDCHLHRQAVRQRDRRLSNSKVHHEADDG